MSNVTARLGACRKLLHDYDRTQDRAFRRGSQTDWYQWSARLASALRTTVQLAADGQALLADARKLNGELLDTIEMALLELGLTEHAGALRTALADEPEVPQ